jgi:hypothetical protein
MVVDVWGSLGAGSLATGAPLRPLSDIDVLSTGAESISARTGTLPWSRAVRMLKSRWGVSVRMTVAEHDSASVRQVAASLATLLLSCDALEVARPDRDLPNLKLVGIGPGDVLLVDVGRFATSSRSTRHADRTHDALLSATGSSAPLEESEHSSADNAAHRARASHARLAEDLRKLTGLPAVTLGAALGVTREQYQRWLRGDPISIIRHGLLVYLHTIAADAARRLGHQQVAIWWRTPSADGVAPEQLLRERLTDSVHRLVAALPDDAPVLDGVLVALQVQQPLNIDEYDDFDDAYEESDSDNSDWSPRGEAGQPPT